MPRTFWHRYVHRPIQLADEGRFVLGRGHGGWTAGYVTYQRDGMTVDTGDLSGSPMSRYRAANGMRVYTFLDAPPPWEEPENDLPLRQAKIVKLRER